MSLVKREHALFHSHTRFTYQWFIRLDQSFQVHKSIYHFHDCSIQTQSSHVNNVDSTNVVTNINGEEITISPGYYTLSEVIAILNTMINTTFSITTIATSYECIWIQSPYSIDFARYILFRNEFFALFDRKVTEDACQM